MYYRTLLPVLYLTINSFKWGTWHQVSGASHDLSPFGTGGSWFGSLENGRQLEESPNYVPASQIYDEFSNLKRRKLKNKETHRKPIAEENTEKSHTRRRKKKRKRSKKRTPAPNPRRFVKTIVADGDKDKDSNMTDSFEVTKKSKPVDIIVHIKMSD